MKKFLILIIVLVNIGYISFAQQKSIFINLKNKITSQETKIQNDKIIEVIQKDFGFSELNIQLLNLTIDKLADVNFAIFLDNKQPTDYDLIIDSIHTNGALASVSSSTFIKLSNNRTKKIHQTLFKDCIVFERFTETMSDKIVAFIIEKLKDELISIILYDKYNSEGKYIINDNSADIRQFPSDIVKPIKALNPNENITIISVDSKKSYLNEKPGFWVNVKLKDSKTTGWVFSPFISKQ